MDSFRERLAERIREFGDDWELSQVYGRADKIAEVACDVIDEEVVPALHQLVEENATRGMDFGRGYALAIKDATTLLAVLSQR